MAYGSGRSEGRSGGAGRMGIWKTADGQYRVIKFNTKIGDRLGGDSMADDPRMLESCNRLRQELVLIATSAGVDPKVMRQIRAKLGLPAEGGTDAGKLLDRSDVADVVTLIGGDKVWEDALHGRDMKDYKSDAHSSFKSLSERDFKVPSNVSEAIRDDGSRLTAASVRSLLVNVRGVEVDSPLLRANKQEKASVLRGVFDTVFDNDFAVKFAKEMTRPDGGYDELSVTTRLKTSVRLFFASSVKPDGTVNQFDERTRGDLLAACRLEVGSGSLSAFEKRLGDAGVTFADCFARGGSVIFANEKAIAAGEKEQVRQFELKLSYRSTREIIDYSKSMLKRDSDVTAVDRSGAPVEHLTFDSPLELPGLIVSAVGSLKQSPEIEHAAILCRTIAEAQALYSMVKDKLDVTLVSREEEGTAADLVIMPVYFAKGLEFDGVVAVEAAPTDDDGELSYILCTRALHRLVHITAK